MEAVWNVQVLHEKRIFYNCRNGWDIARFLADPTLEDVEAHLFNLRSAPASKAIYSAILSSIQHFV